MSGGEALRALGWVRTHGVGAVERWALEMNDYHVILLFHGDGVCTVESHLDCYGGGVMPRAMTQDEMEAVLERMRELTEGGAK